MRASGSPIAIAPMEVLGSAFSETARTFSICRPIGCLSAVEFPAFYRLASGSLVAFGDRTSSPTGGQAVRVLALLIGASLATSWLLASVNWGQQRPGWRAVLPAVMLLVAFSAAAISRWLATVSRIPVVLAGLGCCWAWSAARRWSEKASSACANPPSRFSRQRPRSGPPCGGIRRLTSASPTTLCSSAT